MKRSHFLTFYAVYLLTLGVKKRAQLLPKYNYNRINFEIGRYMYFCQYL
jgi:hypothetical protein